MAKPLSITKEELIALKPCEIEKRLKLFKRRKRVTVAQALKAGTSIRDILWVAGKLGHKDLCIKFALLCAQRAVQFDKSGTAQSAIDAAKSYIEISTTENLNTLNTKRRAAYAAADAAGAAAGAAAYAAAEAAGAAAGAAAYTGAAGAASYAAAAADVAAYAAYAADAAYAAYAVADAAYAAAAADAAYAADAAAYAATRQREVEAQKKILVEVFS